MRTAPPAAPEGSPDRDTFLVDIPAKDMQVDTRYQPPERFNERRARRIAAEWDWGLYEPVKVAIYADGSPYLVDGQHRRAAAVFAFGDDVSLPAYVLGEVTPAAAARIFANADKNRVGLSVGAKTRAEIEGGEEEALAIQEIVRRHGWELSFVASASSQRIACIATLKRIFRDRKGGPERLDQAIRIITMAWGHQQKAVSAQLIAGIARFLRAHGADPAYRQAHLIDRLRTQLPEEITGKLAKRMALEMGLASNEKDSMAISLVLRDLYNHRLTGAKRLGASKTKTP